MNPVLRFFEVLRTPRTVMAPVRLDRRATLEHVLGHGCSVARFGDGELLLAFPRRRWMGARAPAEIAFQRFDPRLSELLREAWQDPAANLLLCFNNAYLLSAQLHMAVDYYGPIGKKEDGVLSVHAQSDVAVFDRPAQLAAYRRWATQLDRFAVDIVGDATFLVLALYYQEYRERRIREICLLLRRLFEGRRVLFVCPESPLRGPSFQRLVEQHVIDSPVDVGFIAVPDHDAFSSFDELLERILSKRGTNLVVLQAGPTATALAVELSRRGVQALDVGRLNVSLARANEMLGVRF